MKTLSCFSVSALVPRTRAWAFSAWAGSPGGVFDVRRCLESSGFQTAAEVEKVSDRHNITLDSAGSRAFYRSFFGGEECDDADVTMFHVETDTDGQNDPATNWDGFYNHESRNFFIKAPATISPVGKESLISLLEVAEELNGSKAYLCIEQDSAELSSIVRAFMYLGFKMVTKSALSSLIKGDVNRYVVLGYDLEV